MRSAACCTGWSPATGRSKRRRACAPTPCRRAVQAADRSRYRAEFLAAIDWALAPHEDQRPQSVAEWRRPRSAAGPRATPAAEPKCAPPPAQPRTKPTYFDPAFLKQVERELAQHLGPIAAGGGRNAAKKATTQAELVHLLAAEITDAPAKAAFEKKFSGTFRGPTRSPRAARAPTPRPRCRQPLPLEVLEQAEHRLAEYIGAVARVVVKRAAMKARDERELYLLLADEIEDKDERKASPARRFPFQRSRDTVQTFV